MFGFAVMRCRYKHSTTSKTINNDRFLQISNFKDFCPII